ncbi:response regulator [Acinetobacter equi]|uniref:Pilus assembly protein PilG n=1 Tax=Acinetobacter equi TaxID=1324350 RepID=A0A0N9W1K1_9GAMM|nr:response regulator [Acinetobacter equi]ALH95440.1 pilus assembly protein PilG [Acinetobacter equi]
MSEVLKNLKVLVVDHSHIIRRTTETFLQREGCVIQTMEDGFESLAHLSTFNPDIILIDVMLERLNGYQVCALIKNTKDFQNTPIIMLSTQDSLFDQAKGQVVGANASLMKPFSKDELLNAIRQHIKV